MEEGEERETVDEDQGSKTLKKATTFQISNDYPISSKNRNFTALNTLAKTIINLDPWINQLHPLETINRIS